MNCPVCDRSLAPTLSICPSCGAMMYDSVREELQTKITSGPLRPTVSEPDVVLNVQSAPAPEPVLPAPSTRPPERPLNVRQSIVPPPMKRPETAGLAAPKTSPTLVGFQSPNTSLPDWRIKLQNSVQQRRGGSVEAVSDQSTGDAKRFPLNGGAALNAEIVQPPKPAPKLEIADQRVANALRRIEESRIAFQEIKPTAPAKRENPHPFGVVAPSSTKPAGPAIKAVAAAKPKLVSPPPIVLKRDTNKLSPLPVAPEVEQPPVIERVERLSSGSLSGEFADIRRIHIKADVEELDGFETVAAESDEIEDLAPFSMRFCSGLFDMIISGFASLILISPLAFTRGDWFSTAALLTLAATFAVVTFIYMTACLGFFGKTLGMRLFSLELVDAVENEYPTMHQAAVNSAIYLISLVFAGAGFATVFFNEERRAAHDLLSGTILVREF